MKKTITFIILLTIWLIWSGFYDPFHIGLGVISSLIVVFWSGDLLISSNRHVGNRIKEWLKFELYSVWLMWEIVLANFQIVKLSFHPNLLQVLEPKLVTFNSKVTGEVPLFILAQSITLTPGTVAVKIIDNQFYVHAIDNNTAAGVPGQMESRVLDIFKGASK